VEPVPAHIPVLLREVLECLAPAAGETYLDCTVGLGGHAAAVAGCLGLAGVVALNDSDPGNLRAASARLAEGWPSVRVVAFHGNFADAPRRLGEMGLAADLVLADLGFSSNQVEDGARGLSFQRDGPLDMRLDPTSPATAADLVASTPEGELAKIIREFGEEPAAGRIARKLVEVRRTAPISTTGQLAEIVRSVIGRRPGPTDPATRTFQALRIAVNDELGSLAALLASVERAAMGRAKWLKAGARVAVISFHSLEDRLVKKSFAGLVSGGFAVHAAKGPVTASEEEMAVNPRSRSAKLRAIRLVSTSV